MVIEPDETVILRCPMAEMGQGTGSGLPMLLAEELECDWSKVKVEFASVNRNIRENSVYGDQMTAGSRGIRTTWPYVQQAGASARARLIAAAAAKWNVPASECSASQGQGDAQAPAAAALTLWRTGGRRRQSQAGRRARDQAAGAVQAGWARASRAWIPPIKSDGTAKFGIDTREPGQLYASIMSCPVFGGKLVSVDDSADQERGAASSKW